MEDTITNPTTLYTIYGILAGLAGYYVKKEISFFQERKEFMTLLETRYKESQLVTTNAITAQIKAEAALAEMAKSVDSLTEEIRAASRTPAGGK